MNEARHLHFVRSRIGLSSVLKSPSSVRPTQWLTIQVRPHCPQLRIHDISIIVVRNRESRLISIMNTNRPITEASPHVSVSDIESCFDELIDGERKRHDVTLMPAMA